MNDRKFLKSVRDWIEGHSTPNVPQQKSDDCVCELGSLCCHHDHIQDVYTGRMDPKTAQRLLDLARIGLEAKRNVLA